MNHRMNYIAIFILSYLTICGQSKRDHIWFLGYNFWNSFPELEDTLLSIDFSQSPIVTTLNKGLSHSAMNTAISDEEGNLLFYSNGCAVANADHEVMPNGDSLNYGPFFDLYWTNDCSNGYPGDQSMITVTDPGNPEGYYMFHYITDLDSSLTQLDLRRILSTYVDMRLDGGKGDVAWKNRTVVEADYRHGQALTAINHANGKDWWILNPVDGYTGYVRLLITANGIENPITQYVNEGTDWINKSGGGSSFSPDGDRFAIYNSDMQLMLYDFDRESGELSNEERYHILDRGGNITFCDVEWSPSGRYLYVCDGDYLWQVDTWSSDIQNEGILLIDEWDGTRNPFKNGMNAMYLGPDCKIYVFPRNGSASMHVIYRPDEYGADCRFVQNAIHFPLPAYKTLGISPNHPRWRIDEEAPCDPLLTSTTRPEPPGRTTYTIKCYPNPATSYTQIEIPAQHPRGSLAIHDMQGRTWYEADIAGGELSRTISLHDMPAGIYQVYYRPADADLHFVNGLTVVRE